MAKCSGKLIQRRITKMKPQYPDVTIQLKNLDLKNNPVKTFLDVNKKLFNAGVSTADRNVFLDEIEPGGKSMYGMEDTLKRWVTVERL